MDVPYANAYQEVLEILKIYSKGRLSKNTKGKIELFETNANHEYIFSYNPEKTLTEQEVSKLAKGMIALCSRLLGNRKATRENTNQAKSRSTKSRGRKARKLPQYGYLCQTR